MGFEYTRLTDDIHLSSRQRLAPDTLRATVQMLRSGLEKLSHRPKRAKQFVAIPQRAMRVHRLNVNSIASVPGTRRQSLRNEVFLLERWSASQPWDGQLEAAYFRLRTRVGHLRHTNPGDPRRLMSRLDALISRRSA